MESRLKPLKGAFIGSQDEYNPTRVASLRLEKIKYSPALTTCGTYFQIHKIFHVEFLVRVCTILHTDIVCSSFHFSLSAKHIDMEVSVCELFHEFFCNSDCITSMAGIFKNNELERIWKQMVVASSKPLPEVTWKPWR